MYPSWKLCPSSLCFCFQCKPWPPIWHRTVLLVTVHPVEDLTDMTWDCCGWHFSCIRTGVFCAVVYIFPAPGQMFLTLFLQRLHLVKNMDWANGPEWVLVLHARFSSRWCVVRHFVKFCMKSSPEARFLLSWFEQSVDVHRVHRGGTERSMHGLFGLMTGSSFVQSC